MLLCYPESHQRLVAAVSNFLQIRSRAFGGLCDKVPVVLARRRGASAESQRTVHESVNLRNVEVVTREAASSHSVLLLIVYSVTPSLRSRKPGAQRPACDPKHPGARHSHSSDAASGLLHPFPPYGSLTFHPQDPPAKNAKMSEVDGASPKEQILEACRRDNVDLFNEVLEAVSKAQSKEKIADFFNTITDTMGNYLLHVCASYGSCTPSATTFLLYEH